MDPYDCICEYIWSMRRLFAGLQQQNHCTDTECFSEHPGFETGQGSNGDPGQAMQIGLVLLIWIVIAIVLFVFRPASLRRSGDQKPPPTPPDSGRRPSPPAL